MMARGTQDLAGKEWTTVERLHIGLDALENGRAVLVLRTG
jgi:hypothetical protein